MIVKNDALTLRNATANFFSSPVETCSGASIFFHMLLPPAGSRLAGSRWSRRSKMYNMLQPHERLPLRGASGCCYYRMTCTWISSVLHSPYPSQEGTLQWIKTIPKSSNVEDARTSPLEGSSRGVAIQNDSHFDFKCATLPHPSQERTLQRLRQWHHLHF